MKEPVIRLTSSEIGTLWTGYMNDSMAKQVLRFMLKHVQDPDIKPVIQYAYDASASHVEKYQAIFEAEQYKPPTGFTEKDVNMDAPWLFTDVFCLSYVNHMARVAMETFSGCIAVSYREDICDFYSQCLKEANTLYTQSLQTGKHKGISYRHPYIEVPKESDYVESKKYMSGLNPFSEKRPLNAIEISHLFLNVMTNSIGVKLCLAFAQTSPLKEVQEYMLRLKKVSKKHIKLFVDTLLKEEIQSPNMSDVAVSNSTTQTFSDKLMMFHVSVLVSAGIGNYARAGVASQRNDLTINYERLSLEVARLVKSGADLMIKNNWLEQPPGIKNKDELAQHKG